MPVRPLTAAERDGLVSHYADGVECASVEEFLARTWQARHWLACDCQPHGHAPAQLFVRRTTGNRFLLARMADRPSHHPRCPYAQTAAIAAARDTQRVNLPPLAALLCRWFSAARLNVLYPYDSPDGLKRQYASLREVSRSLEVGPGRRLYEFSRTHPQGLAALLRRLGRDTASEACVISAVYLAVVNSLAPAELRAALMSEDDDFSDVLSEEMAPERVAGIADDLGPYAVLFAFARDAVALGVRAQHLVAYPVYSRRQLVPLDAPHERRTLGLLLDLQRRLLESRHVLITIRKTLPDEAVHERGISFQVQRLGPNGRPIRSLDVLCVDASIAPNEPVAADTDDVAYHHVHGVDVQSRGDSEFRRRVLAHVVQGVEGPVAREALMHDEAR